jgi:hypothetical protein
LDAEADRDGYDGRIGHELLSRRSPAVAS